MKEYLRELVQSHPNPLEGKNLVREYLQARILESLQRSGAMIPLAFQGGTALRILYGITRFSEDLDFALERPDQGYDFRSYLQAIQATFQAEGYKVETKVSDQKTVHSAFVRFPGLAYDLNLPAQPNEVLSIKIEVDTQPPGGAGLEVDVVRRYVPLRLQHHDRSSLLAGKIHALLNREYCKGRDLYDLLWYLSDPEWPEPNIVMLKNALIQTGKVNLLADESDWRGSVLNRLQGLDWKKAISDVLPFLERPTEAELITLENLTRLLVRVKMGRRNS
jgi:hypothetical protein